MDFILLFYYSTILCVFIFIKQKAFFVRSGYVYLDYGYLKDAGRTGYYWAASAYSSSIIAYRLYFNPTGVGPSSNVYRYNGFSLRCLQE